MNRFKSRDNDPNGNLPAPTLRALFRAVRDAEVLVLSFARLQRVLVVDFRSGEADDLPVFVAAVDYGAGGAAVIEKLFPDRPASGRSIGATWGGSTRAFAEQGILPAILNRLPADQTAAVMAAVEELREAERAQAPPLAPPRLHIGDDRDA